METHTQLNRQSKQTNTKLISGWKRAIPPRPRSSRPGDPLPSSVRKESGGTEPAARRPGPSAGASRGARGSRASPPPAARGSGAGESGNLPFSGISTRALPFALSPPALALPSRRLLVAPREQRDLGTASAAQPAEPRGSRAPSPSLLLPVPEQEIIESTLNHFSLPQKSCNGPVGAVRGPKSAGSRSLAGRATRVQRFQSRPGSRRGFYCSAARASP